VSLELVDLDDLTIQPIIHKTYRVNLLPMIEELYILDKERGVVRFGDVMNYAQRELVLECERQLRTTGRIRVITLKARQIGISTVIEAIIFSLSILFTDFNSLILSHEKDSAEHILTMTKRYWNTYPFRDYHVEKYNGRTHLAWADLGSNIRVGTAKNEKAGRSKTIQALHASEVAFWEQPETMMNGLRNSIPNHGLTAIFLESTANGIGNYFHRTWNEASKGDNEFVPMFFPWHKHPEYRAAYLPESEREKFKLNDLDEEEQTLRSRYRINDDRLIWRRWAITNLCQGDLEKFHQEYPTTPHEAFVSTGRNVFPLRNLVAHYEPQKGLSGRLITVSNRLQFYPEDKGPLTIYTYPSEDKEWGVYIIGADPTHTTAGDYACAQVLNRRTLEVVATYRRKTDPITFAGDLKALGHYYNNALIAPEKTGPGYATIGALVASNYPFLYETQKVDTTPGINNDTYGWGTSRQTKHLAISHLVKAFMDRVEVVGGAKVGLIVHDETTMMELRDYVTTEDGQGYENGDGSMFDDGVMALAIAVTVHNIEPPVHAYTPPVRDPADVQPAFRVKGPDTAGRPHYQSGTGEVPGTGPRTERTAREVVERALNQETDTKKADSAPWDEWDDDE
jgi:hypothetical protein